MSHTGKYTFTKKTLVANVVSADWLEMYIARAVRRLEIMNCTSICISNDLLALFKSLNKEGSAFLNLESSHHLRCPGSACIQVCYCQTSGLVCTFRPYELCVQNCRGSKVRCLSDCSCWRHTHTVSLCLCVCVWGSQPGGLYLVNRAHLCDRATAHLYVCVCVCVCVYIQGDKVAHLSTVLFDVICTGILWLCTATAFIKGRRMALGRKVGGWRICVQI